MSETEEPDELTAAEVDIPGLYPRDNTWGNKIVVEDESRAYGFMTPQVSEGDTFAQQMESGRVAVFRLVNVDNKRDPRDQFFADVEPVAYLEKGEERKLKPNITQTRSVSVDYSRWEYVGSDSDE